MLLAASFTPKQNKVQTASLALILGSESAIASKAIRDETCFEPGFGSGQATDLQQEAIKGWVSLEDEIAKQRQ